MAVSFVPATHRRLPKADRRVQLLMRQGFAQMHAAEIVRKHDREQARTAGYSSKNQGATTQS